MKGTQYDLTPAQRAAQTRKANKAAAQDSQDEPSKPPAYRTWHGYNLSLKSVSHAPRLSEETNAFAAILCLDGIEIAHCKNDGRGGSTHVSAYPDHRIVVRKIEADISARDPKREDIRRSDGSTYVSCETLDTIVDQLFEQHLATKQMKKLMKSKVVFQNAGQILTQGYKGVTALSVVHIQNLVKLIRQDLPNAKILNDLPEHEALRLFLDRDLV